MVAYIVDYDIMHILRIDYFTTSHWSAWCTEIKTEDSLTTGTAGLSREESKIQVEILRK